MHVLDYCCILVCMYWTNVVYLCTCTCIGQMLYTRVHVHVLGTCTCIG